MPTQLIIGGFHRSGTSLIAKHLHEAGLFLGEDLLGATPHNVHGHFEDASIVQLHDQALRAAGMDWATVRAPASPTPQRIIARMQRIAAERDAEHEMWGFKDPRVCLYLDDWRHVLSTMRVVLVIRSPTDAVESLLERAETKARRPWKTANRRLRAHPELGLRMWMTYNERLLAFADRHPDDVLFVNANHLPTGTALVDEISRRWNLTLNRVALRDALRRSPTESSLPREVQAIWGRMQQLAQWT